MNDSDRHPRFGSALGDYPSSNYRCYALSDVDLLKASDTPDIVPAQDRWRRDWARQAALEATVYGLPAVMQYLVMRQALAGDDPGAANTWFHDRLPASVNYASFTTPNADTLYSQAWIDLRGGPVELVIPAMGDRYYTAHLLDAHSNAVNLSSRTVGPEGGRFLLHTAEQGGALLDDPGVVPVTVASPIMWMLGRILLRGPEDLPNVHRLQDRLRLTPGPNTDHVQAPLAPLPAPGSIADVTAEEFLSLLDHILRIQGHPESETALVYRWRALGLDAPEPLNPRSWDGSLRAGIEAGYQDALQVISDVRGQRGATTAGGWRILHSGSYGYNYLHRAATNYMGLGATVREENASFTTFVDGAGRPLDGSTADYFLDFEPPVVGAFWSLSVYDLNTRQFIPNNASIHTINNQITELRPRPDGRLHIAVSKEPPDSPDAHWLPIHDGPFYLVIRAYLGAPDVVDGRWYPAEVRPIRQE